MKQTIEHKKTVIDADSKELERKEKLYSLLPEAPMHLKRIEALLESSQKKMALLEHEWEDIKQPLEDEYQCLLQTHNNVNWLFNTILHHIKTIMNNWFNSTECCSATKGCFWADCSVFATSGRGDPFQGRVHHETRESTWRYAVISPDQVQLTTYWHNMTCRSICSWLDLFRSFYTQRILSIVANVKKQNQEMQRVIGDVKSVQRENNSLLGKVERTFTVTDEMIFRVIWKRTKNRWFHSLLIFLPLLIHLFRWHKPMKQPVVFTNISYHCIQIVMKFWDLSKRQELYRGKSRP